MSGGPFLYPNVTSVPSQKGITPAERGLKKQPGVPGEFDKVFDRTLQESGLDQIKAPLKFSAHATQRLAERGISLSPEKMGKINNALDQAAAKGVQDSLILTEDAALIVSVKNRTVVTALDRNSLSGNVFTNIDGAVIV